MFTQKGIERFNESHFKSRKVKKRATLSKNRKFFIAVVKGVEFLGESDSDDEYVSCESSYSNPQSEESIQITEKKEPDANCLGAQAKPIFFA